MLLLNRQKLYLLVNLFLYNPLFFISFQKIKQCIHLFLCAYGNPQIVVNAFRF